MNKDLAKKNNNLKVRIPMYFVGLFLMTIGIAISVKSNLGVSPVSSIPYTMTCVWGIEMGKATILFHTILVLIQIILLRRNFKPINLLQIAVGVVFRLLYDLLQLPGIFFADTGKYSDSNHYDAHQYGFHRCGNLLLSAA